MTEQQLKAASLVAGGKLIGEKIAEEVGVSRRTIETWKTDPEFQAKVKELRGAWRKKAQTEGVADADMRLRINDDLRRRIYAIIRQRGKHECFKGVPGGNSGLLTVTYKIKSGGADFPAEAVPEYRFDKAIIDALLQINEQTTILQGKWKQKVEHSGELDLNVLMQRLNAGRQRAAEMKAKRDAIRANRAAAVRGDRAAADRAGSGEGREARDPASGPAATSS